ncbi:MULTISPECIES: DUF4190 domain-containing protein [Nonomuraea]|uniref:DUF4190 domain-containing protein n=1 Tax=Nonomuraea mangrovi TaxID=2316207 RepID=A0ABW4TAE3_9ACTN
MSYGNQGGSGGYGEQPPGGGYGPPAGGQGSGGYGPPPGGQGSGGYGAGQGSGGYGSGGYGAQPPGGYPPPPGGGYDPYGGYGAPQPNKTNGMAIAALISGIVGLVTCGVASIVGAILGHISLGQIKKTGEEGRGMALAGLILSYVGLAGWVIFLVIWIGFLGYAASVSSSY